MLATLLRRCAALDQWVVSCSWVAYLLPCPLTVSVLGFAWAQSSAVMVVFVLLSLALGISLTIGIVAVLAILARSTMGAALAHRLPQLERGARVLQGVAAVVIIVLGTYAIAALAR